MSKESFKAFVRVHPELVSHVNNHSVSWQQLYEMYDIYGEDHSIWDSYFHSSYPIVNTKDTMNELLSMIRNVDLETVQKGVNGLQKAIGLLQEIGSGKSDNTMMNYEERPMYKYYED